MPLGSLTSSLNQALSGLLGGTKTTPTSQPSQTGTSTPVAPVADVSKDRLDVTAPTETGKEPALPVAAYAPPVEVPKAAEQPQPQLPAVTASVPAGEPALPAAAADFPAAAAAAAAAAAVAESGSAAVPALPATPPRVVAGAGADDDAAAPAAGAVPALVSTGAGIAAEASEPGATRASTGAAVERSSLSTDEDKARAMAIKALDQERRLNMASHIAEAAASSSVAQDQKAAAKASAEGVESKRPALLVA